MTSTTFDPQKGLCVVDRLLDLLGGMAEWFKAPVLKTGDPQGSVGSNPTPSAMLLSNALPCLSISGIFLTRHHVLRVGVLGGADKTTLAERSIDRVRLINW
jgi:hypothetical protein